MKTGKRFRTEQQIVNAIDEATTKAQELDRLADTHEQEARRLFRESPNNPDESFMDEQEIKLQMARVTKYRELEKVRDEIRAAIEAVTKNQKDGPCGQGPFTGNTRESRQVKSMHLCFTPTRGGAPAVDMNISGLHIEAWELGKAIEAMLRAKLEPINAEIAKL